MPDQRQHRGPHPQDRELFAASRTERLQLATGDLSWLLDRGYAIPSALKLVGDRYDLLARQRLAVARSACGSRQRERRLRHRLEPRQAAGEEIWIDGYNVLTSIEAALAGGVILHARDGCYRDLASMHGSYRRVQETTPALLLLGEALASWRVAACRWLLDEPVSNSGRLKSLMTRMSEERGWAWRVELAPDPDAVLGKYSGVIATADSQILNTAKRWLNLAREVIDSATPEAWIVDLSHGPDRDEP